MLASFDISTGIDSMSMWFSGPSHDISKSLLGWEASKLLDLLGIIPEFVCLEIQAVDCIRFSVIMIISFLSSSSFCL